MEIWAPIFIAISVIFVIYLVVKNWRFYYLIRKLPTCPGYRFIIGHVYELYTNHDELGEVFLRKIKETRSQSMVCAWIFHRPVLFLTKHQSAEAILSSSQEIEKAISYDSLHPWLGLGLLTSTGNRWRAHRKLLTPSFHFRILENFLPVFNEQSHTLVALLSKKAGSGRFDVYPYITRCALDVICETAMGRRIDCQLHKNNEYFNASIEISDMLYAKMSKPWLQIPWIFDLSPSGRIQKKCLKILHGFTNKVIQEKRKEYEKNKGLKTTEAEVDEGDHVYGRKNRKAFLDTLIEASYNGEMGLTDEIIREQTDTFMFEGHDTTAVNMSWVIFCLGCCPSVQDVAHQEIDRIFGKSDRPVNLEDLNELKYLEAVIKETLRLLPSVPFFGRRLSSDVNIDGYTVPSGTEVFLSPWAIGSDPDVFDNPMNFDPMRFFNDDFQTRHPYAYVPFSAGPRNCIGQKFAMMEEKVILANILRNFEIKTFNDFSSLKAAPDLILRPVHGIPVSLEKRSGPLSDVTQKG